MKGKYLITTDNWFFAPDGKLYRSIWGDISILKDSVLGVDTNRNSTNWYARIGSDDNHVIVAGCQIHYAVKCELKPNTEPVEDWNYEKVKTFVKPTAIYLAE